MATPFPMDREAAEQEIALLVRKPGFDELTPGDIVRHMNTRFNINFDAHKSELKSMVIQEIKKRNEDETSGGESDSDSDDDDVKPKKEPEEEEEEEAVKKEESSSDSDDDQIEDKDAPKKTTKRAKKDPLEQDMISNLKSSSSRRAAASNAIKQIRSSSGRFGTGKAKAKKEKDPNEDHSGRFGRLTKLCYISPELQTVTGDEYMKRCDVVKKLWDYIKENDLKDPKAGQFIICNDVLEPIFKRKRVKGFGMTKYLTRHIIGPADMTAEQKAESEREMAKRTAEWLERKRLREQDEETAGNDGPEEKKLKAEESD